ncbi:FmdB family zinc ribbon protein [Paracoccus sp. PAR01]|uniref:FmdB family zinc ribbon protein n=1 Tax=Paracoccus sp. PAR01 TaxID=2769282 RepID=UPI0017814B29|nr:FmdB family zinc ribbon protein [Paracoccus sp. PAR01]MBD9527028.1 zinc ribbon domain-containing protein [Paracoccus sp. PAR01]
MPTYDYICIDCGSFQAHAAMADFEKPHSCPWCSAPARRAMLSAPLLANMDAGRRHAHVTNERSADSPRRSHGAGCSCCSGAAKKKPTGTLHRPDGSKSFPAKRPWMISH